MTDHIDLPIIRYYTTGDGEHCRTEGYARITADDARRIVALAQDHPDSPSQHRSVPVNQQRDLDAKDAEITRLRAELEQAKLERDGAQDAKRRLLAESHLLPKRIPGVRHGPEVFRQAVAAYGALADRLAEAVWLLREARVELDDLGRGSVNARIDAFLVKHAPNVTDQLAGASPAPSPSP